MAPVREPSGRPKSNGLIVFLTLVLLVMLVAAYVGVMNLLLEVSEGESVDTARRDLAYAYVHLVLLVGAAVIGFLAGRWFNGLGIAFATLFAIVLVVGMLTVQLSTYELACHGHNDIVRHWQC
jgi:predicted permease